jgi:hypothetical protein
MGDTEVNPENTEETPEKTEVKTEVKPEEVKTYSKDEVQELLKEQYNTLNKKLSAQGAEIARLRKSPQADNSEKVIESLIRDKKSRQAESGNEDPEIKVLEQELASRKYQQQIRQQRELVEDKRSEYYSKLQEAGLELDDIVTADLDDALDDEIYMGDGSFKRAERQFKKLLKSVPKKEETKVEEKETPKETEEQMRERIERELLEKHGLTKPEKAKPSGSGEREFADVEKDYVEGKVSRKEYEEARKSRGL